MAANFLNNSGEMVGFDVHKYWVSQPAPPFTAPVPAWVYLVAAPFSWFAATGEKRTCTVTSDTFPMIQGGFEIKVVPHGPIPGPAGWMEIVELILIHLLASSKARLTAHSVTGQGSPLATCIASDAGLNVNCQELFDAPSGAVVNVNSVETSPTAGDYLGAIVGYAVDAAIGWAVGELPLSAQGLWHAQTSLPNMEDAFAIGDHSQKFVQQWVDGSFSEAVDGLVSDYQAINDKVTGQAKG
jgi:hypothetical protein